jgi:hypothetical protein
MISFSGRPKRGKILEIAIVLSIALHLLIGSLVAYRYPAVAKLMHRLLREQNQKEMVALSTAITIEKRTRPRPAPPVRPRPARRVARLKPRTEPHAATAPQPLRQAKELPRPQPSELAKIVPRATPQETAVAARMAAPRPKNPGQLTRQQLAAMERRFAQTIALARAQNDPTRVAPSTAAPATMKRAHLDIEGINELLRHGEGILTPREEFRAAVDGDSKGTCYYVDYQINFSDGGFDAGPVYWPICYARRKDPFLNEWHGFPLPGPPPGWQPTQAEWIVIAAHPLLRLYFPDKFPDAQAGD